jgi:3-phytase
MAIFVVGCAARFDAPAVVPMAETVPAPSREDAADDPAIWVAPGDGGASLILGTDKQTGLYVYDLEGALKQSLPVGPLNNVDLRQGGPSAFDVAVASNDGVNAVSVFSIDRATGEAALLAHLPAGKLEPYGICLGVAKDGYRVFVTYKDGAIDEFALSVEGAPALARIAARKLGSQLEGCVVDEENGRLFVGEEAVGVWSFDLADAKAAPVAIDKVGGASGLVADVEGMSLWRGGSGAGVLVVSAQGASRFIAYDRRPPHAALGAFAVKDTATVDGVSTTDGLDISSAPLGARYPRGLFVAQDDLNTNPKANQNFKLVDWRAIEAVLPVARQ